jgi:shikimate kinase/3-dehydroquinate synthase
MGAGKSTVGQELAKVSGRPFVDVDDEIERRHGPIPELFERGEADFRRIEEDLVGNALSDPTPAVIALGGGAVLSERTRLLLVAHAFAVWLSVHLDDAWSRVGASGRPLARNKTDFAQLFERRQPIYAAVANAVASNAEEVALAALHVRVERRALGGIDIDGDVAVIADEHVLELHPPPFEPESFHLVPRGEAAKSASVVERLWNEIEIARDETIVGYGGGSTTDVAGLVAATFLRGVRWVAVPTTLLGQVDAAIGGKTAIDLPGGKNLVGAFHYPDGVVIDPDVLSTLDAGQRREGMAEVVKTGLVAGRQIWEFEELELIRAAAAFKAGVCLGDPFDTGRRAILNLGHTFAHALETAAGYDGLTHGDAVALGLLAALRLSGRSTEVVDEVLVPQPVRVDRERAWAALQRDKKRGLVLLGERGPEWDVEVPEADIRRALDELISD